MDAVVAQHLVQNVDLNHHGSLYAGRSANWLVETALMAAASLLPIESIVAVRINDINYLAPVYAGEVLKISGRVVYTGRSSLMVYAYAEVDGNKVIDGFLSFVHINKEGHPVPHGIIIQAETEEEFELFERAKRIRNR